MLDPLHGVESKTLFQCGRRPMRGYARDIFQNETQIKKANCKGSDVGEVCNEQAWTGQSVSLLYVTGVTADGGESAKGLNGEESTREEERKERKEGRMGGAWRWICANPKCIQVGKVGRFWGW